MSVKTTIVPVLTVAFVLVGISVLHCCSASDAKAEQKPTEAEVIEERRYCLEQDEISQFAEQLITETGMDPYVLFKFKEGTIMRSEESSGLLIEADEAQQQKIREIECDGYHRVWHIIDGVYRFPQGERRVITYLIVRKDATNLRRAGSSVLSHDYSWFCDTQQGSYGDSIIQKCGRGLHRVA